MSQRQSLNGHPVRVGIQLAESLFSAKHLTLTTLYFLYLRLCIHYNIEFYLSERVWNEIKEVK